MQSLGSHLAQIYIFDVWISEHINQLRNDDVLFQDSLSAFFVEGDVDDYADGIENQVSQRMIEDDGQCFQEGGVVFGIFDAEIKSFYGE